MTASVHYKDANDVEHDFETEAGAGGTTRPVHGLGASVVATFTSIKTAVEAVAALISASKLGVADASSAAIAALISSSRLATSNSALEALISASKLGVADASSAAIAALISSSRLATSNSALEALISSSKLAVTDATAQGKLDTINTSLGTIDGHVDGVEGSLTSILTAVNTPAGGGYGAESIGSTAARVDSGNSHACRLFYFQNIHSTQDLHWGTDSSLTTANAPRLRPGEFHRLPIDNTNRIYFYGSGASTTMRYYYLT